MQRTHLTALRSADLKSDTDVVLLPSSFASARTKGKHPETRSLERRGIKINWSLPWSKSPTPPERNVFNAQNDVDEETVHNAALDRVQPAVPTTYRPRSRVGEHFRNHRRFYTFVGLASTVVGGSVGLGLGVPKHECDMLVKAARAHNEFVSKCNDNLDKGLPVPSPLPKPKARCYFICIDPWKCLQDQKIQVLQPKHKECRVPLMERGRLP